MSQAAKPKSISQKKTEYRCPFMKVYSSRADFGTFTKDYYVINFKRRGGVVAFREGSILLVRQYRFLVNGDSWELPGGTIEDDESIELGLARECFEETGVRVQRLQQLVVYYPGLDNVDNRTTIFFTEDVEVERGFVPNEAEVREIAWVPITQCVSMVFQQEILDAMTVAGILAFALRNGQAAPSVR